MLPLANIIGPCGERSNFSSEASGLGSGWFNAGAALCSSSEHRPKPSRMALQSGTVIAVSLTSPGVFTSLDRRRMTCPTIERAEFPVHKNSTLNDL